METIERDYTPKGVQFYYLYKQLAHPELDHYVDPLTLEERLMHVRQAEVQLGSRIPWIADAMTNELKHALGDMPNSEFIIDPDGHVVARRAWNDPTALRQDSVAAQLVGHQTHGLLSLPLQEFPKESPRRTPVPAGLDEEVDQVTILIHSAPEILALTVDRDEDFVQEPRIAESTLSALQPPGVVGAELRAPLPNGFVRHDDASFGQ